MRVRQVSGSVAWMVVLSGSLISALALPGEASTPHQFSSSDLRLWQEGSEGDMTEFLLTPPQPSPDRGEKVIPTATNALLADIPNAVITEAFSQANPIAGIALVSVSQLPGDRVRVAITGTDAPPVAEVRSEAQGLVLAVTLGEAGNVAEEDAIQVVVTGKQDEGYNPSSATTATRTDTPLRDIPASIQVIPQQVIEDQGVNRLSDAVRNNAPGVTTSSSYAGTGQGEFIIRGFQQNYNFRNGFRFGKFGYIADLSEVERIEVLRGPASILFGQLQPGGVVNLVTEQPLSDPTYTLQFTGGQFSFYRPELDFSGPLTDDGSLRYRLNAVYQNAGSFRDEVNSERVFVAPVLQWNISENTTLTADFSYLYNDPVFDRGLVALSDGSLPLPINRFLGYPSLDDYAEEQVRASYQLEHRFNENWEIRNAFSFSSILRRVSRIRNWIRFSLCR
jgi:iron complex outermembrane receptor protein